MSAFNDFLHLLRLKVDIYHNAKICGDWSVREHVLGTTCFHVVTSGKCYIDVPNHLSTVFNEGDLVIFPREIEHTMYSIDDAKGDQQHLPYTSIESGTGMLCGEVHMLHLFRDQLLNALPPVLMVRNTDQTPWLSQLVSMIVTESSEHALSLHPHADPVKNEAESLDISGSNKVILNRLSELLFIYALRDYLMQSNQQVGILALYGHQKLARALKAFHQSLDKKWSLTTLSREAHMSRTVFSVTFKKISGWTVSQYMTWWRMQVAWEKLRLGHKVSDVALQVGYLSEPAFSRAFRKQFNLSAGQVRRSDVSGLN